MTKKNSGVIFQKHYMVKYFSWRLNWKIYLINFFSILRQNFISASNEYISWKRIKMRVWVLSKNMSRQPNKVKLFIICISMKILWSTTYHYSLNRINMNHPQNEFQSTSVWFESEFEYPDTLPYTDLPDIFDPCRLFH